MDLNEIIANKLNEYEGFRTKFSFNGINVDAIFNNALLDQEEFLIIFKNNIPSEKYNKKFNNIFFTFQKIYSKRINFKIDYEGNEYKYKGMFLNKILDENKKLDSFWKEFRKNLNNFEEYTGDFNLDYNLNIKNDKGIYIFRIENKRMSDDQLKFLVSKFKFNESYMKFLQSKNVTIATRNDEKLINKQLYSQVKNKNVIFWFQI